MSALARILLARGCPVSGSDSQESAVLRDLEAHGAHVFVGHRAENLNGASVVVASAAIKDDNPELRRASERNIPILSRAELLGKVMDVPHSIAVTGTHGKSTTSGMIAYLLLKANLDPTILLGADLPEINGNARPGRDDLVVAEVCEAYDSFLSVHPTYAVLTNIEADHLDYYKTFDRLLQSFRQFIGQIKPDGALIGCGDDAVVKELMALYSGRTLHYGLDATNDLRATEIQPTARGVRYTLQTPEGHSVEVDLSVPGHHNVLNSMAALAVGSLFGIEWEDGAKLLSGFTGTGRRLELVGEGGGIRVYDTYAHHPTEILADLKAVRESFQPGRLMTLFQPHLYSRTQQFLEEFAAAFEESDYALFMDIYGSREQPMEGVNGRLLAERAEFIRPDATTEFVGSHDNAVHRVLTLAAPGDVIVCLGAGDITHTAREIGRKINLSPTLQEDGKSSKTSPHTSEHSHPSPEREKGVTAERQRAGPWGGGVNSELRTPNSDTTLEGFRGKLTRNEPLSRYTTFRIGGLADWYAEPEDREDLALILGWARSHYLPITILGGGSNLLISDKGLPGLVLRLSRLKAVRFEGNDVVTEAGVPLVSLLKRTADQGLSGLEGVVGVPGAVGGALVMNAGTPHGEFGDHLVEAEVLHADGTLEIVPKAYLGLRYRNSRVKEQEDVLVSVRLRLTPSEPEVVRRRMEELDVHRHETQPYKIPSAGCIWKNPKPHTAGRLVDEAGCKGMKEGAAEVSPIHANFIVNHGGATAGEVIRLMQRVRAQVKLHTGIILEPEVQLMGELNWES